MKVDELVWPVLVVVASTGEPVGLSVDSKISVEDSKGSMVAVAAVYIGYGEGCVVGDEVGLNVGGNEVGDEVLGDGVVGDEVGAVEGRNVGDTVGDGDG